MLWFKKIQLVLREVLGKSLTDVFFDNAIVENSQLKAADTKKYIVSDLSKYVELKYKFLVDSIRKDRLVITIFLLYQLARWYFCQHNFRRYILAVCIVEMLAARYITEPAVEAKFKKGV